MKKTILLLILLAQIAFGQDQIKLGVNRFMHNTNSSTFLGLLSGNNISSGVGSTFIGSYSGMDNTTGTNNTFVGNASGRYNTKGSYNTYLGYDAGWQANGDYNVIIGRSAGGWATTGNNNSYIGYYSGVGTGIAPNSGNSNTFLGYVSGKINSTGSFNTFLGSNSGENNSTGSQNTFIAYQSGFKNTIGQNNVYVGWSSGYENTTGGDNTALGTQAGGQNTTGGFNTNVGKLAGYNIVGGNYNVFVGAGADVMGTNKAQLNKSGAIGFNARVSVNDAIVLGDFENSNLKVGIGVHNPRYRLDVKGTTNFEVGYTNPALKINGRDFLGLDEQGEFIVSNFKMKYQSENQWADRVFKKGYVMMPLAQLDEYIQEHEHLPGIPTASEAVEKGVSTQEMTAKLLEKVEELTRYVIELKNENESLKKDYREVLKRLPAVNK